MLVQGFPSGIQEELSQPVAVLSNDESSAIAIANEAGFRCFTTADAFKETLNKSAVL